MSASMRRRLLLDTAPQRVAVEDRGLRGHEDGERAQRRRLDEPGRDRVQGQREQCAEERDVGLEQPGGVGSQELVHHPERREGADRIAVLDEVDVEHRLVRRGCEPGDAAAVLEQAVGEAQPRRGVVELDVARERRAAREEDRRASAA